MYALLNHRSAVISFFLFGILSFSASGCIIEAQRLALEDPSEFDGGPDGGDSSQGDGQAGDADPGDSTAGDDINPGDVGPGDVDPGDTGGGDSTTTCSTDSIDPNNCRCADGQWDGGDESNECLPTCETEGFFQCGHEAVCEYGNCACAEGYVLKSDADGNFACVAGCDITGLSWCPDSESTCKPYLDRTAECTCTAGLNFHPVLKDCVPLCTNAAGGLPTDSNGSCYLDENATPVRTCNSGYGVDPESNSCVCQHDNIGCDAPAPDGLLCVPRFDGVCDYFGSIIYVDAGTGSSNYGSSWSDAMGSLDAALQIVPDMITDNGGDVTVPAGRVAIFVRNKDGEPQTPSSGGPYLIPAGVSIYGGFSDTIVRAEDRRPFINDGALFDLEDGAANGLFLLGGYNILDGVFLAGNGGTSLSSGTEYSGLITVQTSAVDSPIAIRNSKVSEHAANRGAGVYVSETGSASSITIERSVFTELHSSSSTGINDANHGGAIYVDGRSIAVRDSVFVGNSAGKLDTLGMSLGGAIFVANTRINAQGNFFIGNGSSFSGGAVALSGTAAGSFVGERFADNSARFAGAILFGSTSSAHLEIYRSVFTNNKAGTAGDTGSVGGAISVDSGSLTLTTSTFLGNAAAGMGGALYLGGDGTEHVVRNATFFENSATEGQSVSVAGGASLVLWNSVVAAGGNTDSGAHVGTADSAQVEVVQSIAPISQCTGCADGSNFLANSIQFESGVSGGLASGQFTVAPSALKVPGVQVLIIPTDEIDQYYGKYLRLPDHGIVPVLDAMQVLTYKVILVPTIAPLSAGQVFNADIINLSPQANQAAIDQAVAPDGSTYGDIRDLCGRHGEDILEMPNAVETTPPFVDIGAIERPRMDATSTYPILDTCGWHDPLDLKSGL